MKIYLIAAIAALCVNTANAQPGPGGRGPNPDADGDGKVTLAEFKVAYAARQGRMFARLDTNSDGKVSPDEAKAMAQRAQRPVRGGDGLMRQDANRDGSVTREEMSGAAQRRFEMADTSKDGWLSREELDMMQQRTRGPGPK